MFVGYVWDRVATSCPLNKPNQKYDHGAHDGTDKADSDTSGTE
jgi:hypothetical protein